MSEHESWSTWHDYQDIYHIDAADAIGIKTMIAQNVVGEERANLMAAAPELLAACEEAVGAIRRMHRTLLVHGICEADSPPERDSLKRIYNAIKLVKGERS